MIIRPSYDVVNHKQRRENVHSIINSTQSVATRFYFFWLNTGSFRSITIHRFIGLVCELIDVLIFQVLCSLLRQLVMIIMMFKDGVNDIIRILHFGVCILSFKSNFNHSWLYCFVILPNNFFSHLAWKIIYLNHKILLQMP